MQQIKNNLEEKLHSVNNTVELLKSSSICPVVNKKLLRFEEPREQFNKKCMEAEEFIERIQIEKEIFEQEKLKRRRLSLEKQRKKIEEVERNKKEQKKLAQLKYKIEILNSYKQLRKERELQQVEWNKVQSNLPPRKSTYLYKRNEEKYDKEFILPLLQKAKHELQKKKELYKSITFHEIAIHRKIHDQKIIEKQSIKKQELLNRQQLNRVFIEHQKRFQTRVSKAIKLMDQRQRNKELTQQVEKEAMYKKMKSYASIIKDTFKVHKSIRKKQELQESIRKLKHPVRQARDVKKEYSLANLNLPVRHRTSIKRTNSLVCVVKARPAINYLPELKRRRIEQYKALDVMKCDWSVDLESLKLSSEETYKRISDKVSKMEQQAKVKEHLMSNTKESKKYIEKEEETSDLLLNIVKAKLAMYDKL